MNMPMGPKKVVKIVKMIADQMHGSRPEDLGEVIASLVVTAFNKDVKYSAFFLRMIADELESKPLMSTAVQ